MASIAIPGSKSITITNRTPNKCIRDESIFIKERGDIIYKSYIFFNLNSIPVNVLILSAELVLFKEDYHNMKTNCFINIFPLEDDFSGYTTYRIQPKVNDACKKVGSVCIDKISVEVSIIEIVRAWLDGTIINKGLSIEGKKAETPLLSFGSTTSRDEYIVPVLRIVYDYPCGNDFYAYLPVTINYTDYENPAKYDDELRLIITVVISIKNKKFQVSKEYAYIPCEGTDVINVAYIPQEGITPVVKIACSYSKNPDTY